MDELTPKKAIVIVEDTEAIGEIMKETLNSEPDYQAVVVSDGAQALVVIRSLKARLILLDIGLPGIDGLTLYDMLKAEEATATVPVLFVTAAPDIKEFRKRDITNYIEKPFDLDELLDKVAAICRPA